MHVAELKIDAIYAHHPESFCDKNLAIRKVFAFSDSDLDMQLIALLNLSVLGFSFVFHDKAKRTQQENLLQNTAPESFHPSSSPQSGFQIDDMKCALLTMSSNDIGHGNVFIMEMVGREKKYGDDDYGADDVTKYQ